MPLLCDGRLFVMDFFSSTIARVVNDLPRLWFFGSVIKGRNLFSLRPHFSSFVCRAVIQRGADDIEFGMLIMHRSFYVSMSHGLHDGGQVPGPHENPCAVVMPGTI